MVKRIAADNLALTMCPLSNQRLQSVPDLSKHQLRKFMYYGVRVTVNSDDPAYFGGYVNENYKLMVKPQ
jgi:adenosine deaminase